MKSFTKYVGLDVSKSKIAVAIADQGRDESRFYGTIEHTEEAVRKLMQKLRSSDEVVLDVCYESGPTGNVLYRWLIAMDIPCTIVAPSLIPQRAGDRIKTDSGMRCDWPGSIGQENSPPSMCLLWQTKPCGIWFAGVKMQRKI